MLCCGPWVGTAWSHVGCCLTGYCYHLFPRVLLLRMIGARCPVMDSSHLFQTSTRFGTGSSGSAGARGGGGGGVLLSISAATGTVSNATVSLLDTTCNENKYFLGGGCSHCAVVAGRKRLLRRWGLPRPAWSRRVLHALWGLWFDFSGVNGSSGGGVSVAVSGPLNLGTRLTVSGFTGIGNSVTGGMH